MDSKKLNECILSESLQIRKEKDSVILYNQRYDTPSTSLLLFHFEPNDYASSLIRLKNTSIQHHSIEEKNTYLFDYFFQESEAFELRNYSKNASFSRSSYAGGESIDKGEEPAKSMNNREKWEFFSHPPEPIKEIYKFLGFLSSKLNADISSLPWDLCDKEICASAVATNKLERVSKKSMDTGKHEDFNTEKGIPFGISILYNTEKKFFPANFIPSHPGNPLLLTLMVYATAENFLVPEYGIGTLFCQKTGEVVLKADCCHMRFVLFEGDILHTIEESNIPPEVKTWRISYVFKLILNPKNVKQNMRKDLHHLLKEFI